MRLTSVTIAPGPIASSMRLMSSMIARSLSLATSPGPVASVRHLLGGSDSALVRFLRLAKRPASKPDRLPASLLDREEDAISTTPELRRSFLTLLTAVVSRGDSAAIALRDRVLGSAAA